MTELEEENLEIYGTTKVTPIPAFIVDERVALLQAHLEELVSVHWMDQNNYSINKALAAIKHWKKIGGQNNVRTNT